MSIFSKEMKETMVLSNVINFKRKYKPHMLNHDIFVFSQVLEHTTIHPKSYSQFDYPDLDVFDGPMLGASC